MLVPEKILSLDVLAKKIAKMQAEGLRVVLCHGVFDLLHLGHMRHFEEACQFGDRLVITVTPDRYVNKGAHRPVFTETLRAEAIAALEVVSYISINEWPTAIETIDLLKPDIFCKGGEFKDKDGELPAGLQAEIEVAKKVGTRIEFTSENLLSSSNLINTYLDVFPPETDAWLKVFRDKYSLDDVLDILERASDLNVLVVGESIIDEYTFCEGLGKATKDPILAVLNLNTEAYAGGSLAVANHLAGFCREVGLVTLLGEHTRREDFVRDALLENVQPHFVTQKHAPTIHKRRFVDEHTGARMLELYTMDDTPLAEESEQALTQVLEDQVGRYDLVIVVDYGHGMMTHSAIDVLCSADKFLSVNTQANSGNRGFNTVSRYSRADYVCLTGHEVALETRMRYAPWEDLLLEFSKRTNCSNYTMTSGKDGSLHYSPDQGFVTAPALATQVTDRVGAGDAVLAVTSLLVHQNTPWDMVGFIGNLAGAQMVADLGNRTKISKDSITRHVASLMK